MYAYQENPKLQIVPFHGDEIETIEHDGEHFVAMPKLCQNLGIDPARQREKVVSESLKYRARYMSCPSEGGAQETLCIPIEKVAVWLLSINANKVRPDLRAKLELYQAECAVVLYRYWTGQTVSRVQDPERRERIKMIEDADRLEQEQRRQALSLAVHDNRIDCIEAKQSAYEQGLEFFTVVGFARLMKQQVDHSLALRIGTLAGKISREKGVEIGAVHDRRWGHVNAYHQDVLLTAFTEIMQ